MASKSRVIYVPKVSAPKVGASGILREDKHSMAALSVAAREAKSGTGIALKGHSPVKGKTQETESQTPSEKSQAPEKQCRSRAAAESKLRQMITNTGPDLFVHGTLSGEVQGQVKPPAGAAVVIPSLETIAACKEAAPFDMILEFMTAVMTREYERALEVGKKIIKYEPDNKIVADFIPLLEEIAAFSDSEDEASNDSSAESATTSSGDTSSEESDSEGDEESDSELSPSSSAESDDEHSYSREAEYSSPEDSCTGEEADEDEDDNVWAAPSDPGYDSMNHEPDKSKQLRIE